MDIVDHAPLIKRNLLLLMQKYEEGSKKKGADPDLVHKAAVYKNALLQLPMHPILSERDMIGLRTYPFVMYQIQHIISTRFDLEEVIEYEHGGVLP
jgi:hypothetical protein